MIDENYSNDSSYFSLFTKKELEQKSYIDEINIIVKKYDIIKDENLLISSTQNTFLYLINYLIDISNKKEDLPIDVKKLFLENLFLKEQSNLFLEKKLDYLTKNDSTHFFKDINIIMQILTIGTKEEILNSNSKLNYISISNLFRFYESLLQDLFQNNNELFSLTFYTYIILLKTLTQLCTISSIEIIKEKNINTLIELMTETINIIKYTIPIDEIKMSKINSILGKYLYYFSHIDDISINLNNLDNSLEKYLLSLEKQKDGFLLSKDNHFGEENNNLGSQEFLTFKYYSSILILKLIYKMKNLIEEEKYFYTESFQKILRFYYKNFSIEFSKDKIAKDTKNLETDLLNSLLHNYKLNLNLTKTVTYHSVIEDFVFSESEFNKNSLEIIYRILYFASDIDEFKYYYIAQILVDSSPIKNDYYEFFKLSILELVINKSLNKKYNVHIEDTLSKISDYINQNLPYNLLSIYSKIYLNLSLAYSYHQKDLLKAKKFYSIFIQINSMEIIEDEYSKTRDLIIKNIQSFNPDTNHDDIIKEFLNIKESQLKNEILILNSKIHSKDQSFYKDAKLILSKLISNEIFHGLCEVNILETLIYNKNLQKNEFEEHLIYVNKDCIIQLLFSLSNEKNFNTILKYYEQFLKTDVYPILNYFEKENIRYDFTDDDEYEINY